MNLNSQFSVQNGPGLTPSFVLFGLGAHCSINCTDDGADTDVSTESDRLLYWDRDESVAEYTRPLR